MTKEEIQKAVAHMQAKRTVRALVWKNANGTFSHHLDAACEWGSEDDCRFDLRLHKEYTA